MDTNILNRVQLYDNQRFKIQDQLIFVVTDFFNQYHTINNKGNLKDLIDKSDITTTQKDFYWNCQTKESVQATDNRWVSKKFACREKLGQGNAVSCDSTNKINDYCITGAKDQVRRE